jgi:hypothetical protein
MYAQPSFRSINFNSTSSNIRQPDRIRLISFEGALEEVRGNAVAVPAIGCDGRLLLAPGNAVFPHEPGDPLAGDADTPSLQLGMDSRRPIALTAVLENTSDLANQVGLDAALRCSGLIAGLPSPGTSCMPLPEPRTAGGSNRWSRGRR